MWQRGMKPTIPKEPLPHKQFKHGTSCRCPTPPRRPLRCDRGDPWVGCYGGGDASRAKRAGRRLSGHPSPNGRGPLGARDRPSRRPSEHTSRPRFLGLTKLREAFCLPPLAAASSHDVIARYPPTSAEGARYPRMSADVAGCGRFSDLSIRRSWCSRGRPASSEGLRPLRVARPRPTPGPLPGWAGPRPALPGCWDGFGPRPARSSSLSQGRAYGRPPRPYVARLISPP